MDNRKHVRLEGTSPRLVKLPRLGVGVGNALCPKPTAGVGVVPGSFLKGC